MFGAVCLLDFARYLQGKGAWELLAGLPHGFWWVFGVVLTFWFRGKVGEWIAERVTRDQP